MLNVVVAQDNNYFNSELFFETQEITGPILEYAPASHDFGNLSKGQVRITTFNVWNSGCCQLIVLFSSPVSWVSVSPSRAYSSGENVSITVTVNTDGLAVGPYTCGIQISSNVGNGIFQVDFNVIQPTAPILYFYPQSINFKDVLIETTATESFEIWNAGIDTLTYTLSEDCEWLGIGPSGGSSTGEHDRITISVNTSGLVSGQYAMEVTIDSNGGRGGLLVYVTVALSINPILTFTPQFYDFGEILKDDSAQTFFEIWNSGGGRLHFYLMENYDWVTVIPSEGSSEGEHVTVSVVINTSGVTASHFTCSIVIDSNGGDNYYNFTVSIMDAINTPPTTPVVNGPKSGSQGKASEYSCVSTDINADRIYYNFSWGDGTCSSWRGPFDSGERCLISHIWTDKGVFEITVQAMDSNTTHTKSDWSEPYMIGIDCYLNISVNEAWMLVQDISNGIQIPIDIRPLQFFNVERIDTQSSVEKTRWFSEKLLTKLVPFTFFEVLYIDEEVILYSQNGEDSTHIAQVLVDHGFSGTVYNMVGGIDAWKNAGLPTIKGG